MIATATATATATAKRVSVDVGNNSNHYNQQQQKLSGDIVRLRSSNRRDRSKVLCSRCVIRALTSIDKSSVVFASSEATNDDEEEDAGEEEEEVVAAEEENSKTKELAVRVSLGLIDFYRNEISPLIPRSCRFQPSCSNYAFEAYSKYGAQKGFILTAWRIARCNPFGGSGYDPIQWPPPKLFGNKKE
jgi:putative membrane protein insertion efficiency factor